MSTDDEATKAAAAAIANLASDVYDDVARPAAKQVGTALETIFKGWAHTRKTSRLGL